MSCNFPSQMPAWSKTAKRKWAKSTTFKTKHMMKGVRAHSAMALLSFCLEMTEVHRWIFYPIDPTRCLFLWPLLILGNSFARWLSFSHSIFVCFILLSVVPPYFPNQHHRKFATLVVFRAKRSPFECWSPTIQVPVHAGCWLITKSLQSTSNKFV